MTKPNAKDHRKALEVSLHKARAVSLLLDFGLHEIGSDRLFYALTNDDVQCALSIVLQSIADALESMDSLGWTTAQQAMKEKPGDTP